MVRDSPQDQLHRVDVGPEGSQAGGGLNEATYSEGGMRPDRLSYDYFAD